MSSASLLKQAGLAALSFAAASVDDGDADAALLAEAAAFTATLAAALPRNTLFGNRMRGRLGVGPLPVVFNEDVPPEVRGRIVDGGGATCTASSTRAGGSRADLPLTGLPADRWQAAADEASSWWQVELDAPLYVEHVDVAWRGGTERTSRGAPETFTVAARDGGGGVAGRRWRPVGPPIAVDRLPPDDADCMRVPVRRRVSALRIAMFGFAASPPTSRAGKGAGDRRERAHALDRVTLFTPDAVAPRVAPGVTLCALERLLFAAAVRGTHAATVGAGLRGLGALALAAGSLSGVLRLVVALVALGGGSAVNGGGGGGVVEVEAEVAAEAVQRRRRAAAAAGRDARAQGIRPAALLTTEPHQLPPQPLAGGEAPVDGTAPAPPPDDGTTGFALGRVLPAPDVAALQASIACAVNAEFEAALAAARPPPPPLVPMFDDKASSLSVVISAAGSTATFPSTVKAHVRAPAHTRRCRCPPNRGSVGPSTVPSLLGRSP